MSRPEDFNTILDALEVGLEEKGTIDRPFVLGVIPPKSLRAIVDIEGHRYAVTIEDPGIEVNDEDGSDDMGEHAHG